MVYSNFVPKTFFKVFEIFNFDIMPYLEIGVKGHSRSSETTRFDTYDFLLTFHSNHGPLAPFLREMEISVKNRKIFPLVYFTPQLTGLPLELDIGTRGKKTRMTGLPDGRKSFKICLAV